MWKPQKNTNNNSGALKLAPVVAIAVLIAPLICGLGATILPALNYLPALNSHEFSIQPFVNFFGMPGVTKSIILSLVSGLASTAIALIIVIGFVAAWHGTKTFSKIEALISPLLALPHAAAAFGLVFLVAPSGFITRIISPTLTGWETPPDVLVVNDNLGIAMVAGLVTKEIPFLLLVTLAAMQQVDTRRLTQTAQSFGYGKMSAFVHSSAPAIYKQIRLAVFAVIAYATSVVDVAIILGPSTPPTLAVKLTQWMNDPEITMRFIASAGAVVQLAITITAMAIWIVVEKVVAKGGRYVRNTGSRIKNDQIVRVSALVLISLAAFIVFAGLAILAIWSVAGFWSFPNAMPDSFTTKTWARAIPNMITPIYNTVVIGAGATIIAVVITVACLEREAQVKKIGNSMRNSKSLLLVYLPLLVPQIGFVFGLQIFFFAVNMKPGIITLVIVHLIFVLPYVFLSLSDPWRAWDKRYEDVAHGIGANNVRMFWKIRLPMMTRPILVAAAVGFAVSIGQYLPTILIGAGRVPTITTEAVSLAAGGDRRTIGAFAFMQMIMPCIGFIIAAIIPTIMFRNRADMKVTI